MDKEMKMMVNTIIDEMGRMEERINKRFESVDKRFDKIEQRLDMMQQEIKDRQLDSSSKMCYI